MDGESASLVGFSPDFSDGDGGTRELTVVFDGRKLAWRWRSTWETMAIKRMVSIGSYDRLRVRPQGPVPTEVNRPPKSMAAQKV